MGYGLHSDCFKLYPQSLAFILEELLDLQPLGHQSVYGHQVFVHEQEKLNLNFEVAIVIGDTMGHDAMCCHKKAIQTRLHILFTHAMWI
eukprot:9537444-Ditylum_brightwellii.AAC.1